MSAAPLMALADYRALRRRIVRSYDGVMVRAYCRIRYMILNLKIMHLLSLGLRGRRRVLAVGCGYGLSGCYLASLNPDIEYHGVDLDERRIRAARRAAKRLGLTNARFTHGDAREALALDEQYDAVIMIDLLHHIPDDAKHRLLASILPRLGPGGVLLIKDITRRPWYKLFFTWALDVAMTAGFDMWYWDEAQFRAAVPDDWRMEAYPITDWLPYPHVLYMVSR